MQAHTYLFQQIRETLPPGTPLVDTIADALHISPDSAYRRIRGETPLLLEEAKVLCGLYRVSLDQLLHLPANPVVFQSEVLDSGAQDFCAFLKGLLHATQQLHACTDKSIIYVAKDIPIFHLLSFRPVIAFRYFFWMKTMFQHPDFQHRKFSFGLLPPEAEDLSHELLSLYCRIPSIEVWNTEAVNSVLSQVAYCVETGVMSKTDAVRVYEGLRNMIEHLQQQTELGCKFLPGENRHSKKQNFQLFYNRVGIGDTVILTLQNGRKTLYLNYDVLNYLTTTDEVFCGQAYQSLQTVMRRSTLISGVSEKQRNIFFNILYAKLRQYESANTKRLV